MPDFVALKVKEANQDRILSTPNVIGTGVGQREIDGNNVSAIYVFVEHKLSQDDVISKYSAAEMIPRQIDGVPTKVIEVGKIVKQGFQSRVRPLQPGYSIGHGQITAGTLGGFFKDKDGDIVALTNNHVGANENRAKIGDPIYQPGPMDSPRGSIKFENWTQPASNLAYFGTLKRFVPLNRANNLHDSAIVKVHQSYIDSNLINTHYPQLNQKLSGIGTASIGMRVQKCGRTTGYTTGNVMALHGSFTISYDFGSARFNDCIVLSGMSAGGDSGSLVMDTNMNAVGLLFAGSDKVTLANPMNYLVSEYGLTPYNNELRSQAAEDGTEWSLKSINGSIQATETAMQIDAKAFTSCYLEKRLEKFTSISVNVKPLSDLTSVYGPGIAICCGDSFVKMNLTSNGIQGAFNDNVFFSPCQVDNNGEYIMRFKLKENKLHASVFINNTWINVYDIDYNCDGMSVLRIGKMGVKASDGKEPIEGDTVSSFFDGVKIS
jgi:hypothetical protein